MMATRQPGETLMIRTMFLTAALGLTASALVAAPMTGDSAKGAVLTDANGMTLYTFDADKDGMSACYDTCATNWPPFLASADDAAMGDFGFTERTDGARQWTFKGMPLYTWIKDAKPGDITGDGVKDVWHIAQP